MPQAMIRAIIDYTNHRGVRESRLIAPVAGSMRHTATKWHPAGWVFDALDVPRQVMRTFALSAVHSWINVAAEERGAEP